MALRKEHVLLLAAAAIGLLVYRGLERQPFRVPTQPRAKDYELTPLAAPPLVAVDPDPRLPGRDFFTEPSETQPLPPRDLPFPAAVELGVVGMPLAVGPGPAFAHLLELQGLGVEADPEAGAGAAGARGAEAAVDGAVGGGAPAPQDPVRQPDDQFDRVWTKGSLGPYFGVLEEKDKYALALLSQPELLKRTGDGEKIRFRVYLRTKSAFDQRVTTFGGVVRIELANTLKNQVELRKRQIPAELAYQVQRRQLIHWLVQQGHREAWVYDEALAQAGIFLRVAGGDLSGYRLELMVYRAKGDLEGERALFAGLPDALQGSSFQLVGSAQLMAQLGLYRDAEENLNRAVAMNGRDAEALWALAEFLLEGGRAAEALQPARAAWRNSGSLSDPEQKFGVARTCIDALLSNGLLAAVDEVLTGLASADPAAVAVLRGQVAYARRDWAGAHTAFTAAAGQASGGSSERAAFGQGATAVAEGRWGDALTLYRQLAEELPLDRHRALTGKALVFERTGQLGKALGELNLALACDPTDWYAHYLRGRCLRRTGDLEAAAEALQESLRLRDDALLTLAERVLVEEALAELDRAAEAEHLFAAARYAERLVELDRDRSSDPRFAAIRGRVLFRARDLRRARQVFERAVALAQGDRAPLYGRAFLTLIDYAEGRVEDTRDGLTALQDGLAVDHPFRVWARDTLELVEDHSQKEELTDQFERSELGRLWDKTPDGTLRWRLRDGGAVLAGRASRGKASLRRDQALPGGSGSFLGAEVQLQAARSEAGSFAGMRLYQERGSFEILFGLRAGRPALRVLDGRSNAIDGQQAREWVLDLDAGLGGFDPAAPHRYGLQVVPRDERGDALALVATVDGVVVHRRDLRGLRASGRQAMEFALHVDTRPRTEVDVRFDNLTIRRRSQ